MLTILCRPPVVYSDRSVCRLFVDLLRVVYCGQTVQDRPVVSIEVEQECVDEISIGTISTS